MLSERRYSDQSRLGCFACRFQWRYRKPARSSGRPPSRGSSASNRLLCARRARPPSRPRPPNGRGMRDEARWTEKLKDRRRRFTGRLRLRRLALPIKRPRHRAGADRRERSARGRIEGSARHRRKGLRAGQGEEEAIGLSPRTCPAICMLLSGADRWPPTAQSPISKRRRQRAGAERC